MENKYANIPSAKSINPFKNIFLLMKNARAFIHQKHEELGHVWEDKILGRRIISTRDPELIKYVAINRGNYIRSKKAEVIKLALGEGLVTSEGELWKHQRKLIQPAFHMQSLVKLFDIMKAEVSTFLDELEAYRGQVIDLHQIFMDITGRVVFKAMFSDAPAQDISSFYEIMTSGQRYIDKQLRNPLAKYWLAINGQTKKFDRDKKYLDDLLLATAAKRRASGEKKDDLLQMLMDSTYEDSNEFMSERQLLDELFTIFAAGHETSSNSLTWIMYLLNQYPETVEKMNAEIKSIAGDKLPDFKQLKEMNYLQQIIDEGMRIHPAVWLISRQAIADDEFQGLKINSGDIINLCIYSLHHNPDIYDEPEKFNPSRFTHKEKKKLEKDFAFFPFGGGPRRCIGSMFAIMEIQLILTGLFQRFSFKHYENQKVEMEAMLTMQPKYGLKSHIF